MSVPKICENLADQSLCPRLVSTCGPDSDETACTVKLLFKHVTADANLAVFPYLWMAGKDLGRYTMKAGHDWLHAAWDQTAHWWEADCCDGSKLRTGMDSIADYLSHFS